MYQDNIAFSSKISFLLKKKGTSFTSCASVSQTEKCKGKGNTARGYIYGVIVTKHLQVCRRENNKHLNIFTYGRNRD
jgi:hypothetical protein